MKNQFTIPIILILCLTLFQSCKNDNTSTNDTGQPEVEVESTGPFQAIDMPSTLANGDPFPTDSTTYRWLD